MDVGGRYQTIQVDFKECSEAALGDLPFREETDAFDLTVGPVGSGAVSFSRLSPITAEPPSSEVVPGVFGVLEEEPKDAKAPEPRPKADEPALAGDATLAVLNVEMPLKGFFPVLVLSAPKRLVAEYGREESVLVLSLVELVVDRESLLELHAEFSRDNSRTENTLVSYFERRCQRLLSMKNTCHRTLESQMFLPWEQ